MSSARETAAEKTANARLRYNEASLAVVAILSLWNAATGRADASLGDAVSSGAEAPDTLRALLRDARSPDFAAQRLLDRFEQFAAESYDIIPRAADAFARGDLAAIGEEVRRSQRGVEQSLGNQVPETIALARLACEHGADAASAFGAGFGGSVWALVAAEGADAFASVWRDAYRAEFREAATRADYEPFFAFAHASGLSFAAFRYFNAAGASEDGIIGEDHHPETHLIPVAIDVATGKRPQLELFGTDYPTPDGTCLRDYVHVDDLSRAHIAVFGKLDTPGAQLFYNLGTGSPTSNRAVIRAVEKIVGKPVKVIESPRRPGDPPALFADSTKARRELGWHVKFPDIESIVATAWRWHSTHPRGYGDR